MSEFFSGIDYVPLITPDDKTVGNPAKIFVHDDFFAFYDRARNSTWLFDHEGHYIQEIRIPRGDGPGELNHMTDMVVTADRRVFALGAHKIVEYDSEGDFRDEVNFDYFAYTFTYDPDNDQFLTGAENDLNLNLDSEHAAHNIIYLNREGEIVDSRIPVADGREFISQVPVNRFPVFGDIELYSPHMVDTVYSIHQGNIEPHYLLDFGNASLTEDVFSRRSRYGNTQYDWAGFVREEIEGGGYAFILQLFNETENMIHLRFGAGEEYYNAFYDKTSGETRIGPARLTNDIDYGVVPFIYQSSDDALLAYIDPDELIDHVEHIEKNDPQRLGNSGMEKLVALTDTLERYGNPVLKIAQFKD